MLKKNFCIFILALFWLAIMNFCSSNASRFIRDDYNIELKKYGKYKVSIDIYTDVENFYKIKRLGTIQGAKKVFSVNVFSMKVFKKYDGYYALFSLSDLPKQWTGNIVFHVKGTDCEYLWSSPKNKMIRTSRGLEVFISKYKHALNDKLKNKKYLIKLE